MKTLCEVVWTAEAWRIEMYAFSDENLLVDGALELQPMIFVYYLFICLLSFLPYTQNIKIKKKKDKARKPKKANKAYE